MQAMGRLSRYISQGVYTVSGPFHPFGGAVDIIVVQQQDGSFKSSPWYVRFGKFQGVLKTREKVVNVSVNGTEAAFHMYLDRNGEAYFLMEADGNDGEGIFSPPLSGDETDGQLQNGQLITAQGVDFSSDQLNSATQIDVGNGKIVARTNSRRSRIFGLMFGRKSIKDNGRLKKGDPTMQRINSLERAEIAADLLEMKWSTNLPTDNHRVNIASRLSVSETQAEETDAALQVVDKEEPCIPYVHNSIISSVDNVDNSAEITSPKNPCLQNHGQILQTSEESTVEGACFDGVSVSGQTVLCSQSASFIEPEVVQVTNSGNFENVDTEKAAKGENGDRAVSAYIYSQASITSSIGFDVYGQGDIENQIFSKERGDGVEVYTEVSYSATELVSEVNSEPDSDVPVVKENLNEFDGLDLGLFRGKNSSESCSPIGNYETEMASEKPIEQGISFESSANDGQMILESSLLNRQLPISDSVESKMVEIISHDTVDEELGREKTSETVLAEMWENQCEMADSSFSLLMSNTERVSSGSSSHIESVPVGMNQIPDGIEEGSQAIHSFSHISNSMDQAREVKDLGDGVNMQEVRVLSAVGVSCLESNASSLPVEAVNSSMSPSNSTEEEQFPFSDSDDFVASGVQYEESISAVSVKVDNQTTEVIVEEHELNGINNVNRSFDQETEGIEGEHELGGMNHVPPLPSNQSFPTAGSHIADLNQDSLPNASEDLPGKLQARASPINIPEIWTGAGRVAHLARSLPNLWGNMHDPEMSDVLQPLSHSLDTSSECSKWGILREDFVSSLNLKLGSESNLAGEHPVADAAVVDTESIEGNNQLPSSPAVEISLCRHLLFEGMGANAASQAFEAEKLDLKRFTDLGPSVVKNDKLVVRIGGCYFPWDAAAPIVLGMILYGQKPAFEPEGMIAVDQVVRTLEDELPRAIGPSGGSWRLWPFSFRKSKTERSVRSVPADAKCRGTESENNASEMGWYKASTMKKKKAVRSIVPTSEQLASLNLKDGQNIITFTFSTAMLGRQQVDARIYLWKWNTRIVVSDVDGTITKSDVLGQFMPLVGRDWSQSGVAHLFSAIKDNGYQLLFLSARAISQAYLTRQFLFNLKQDGKALPDGPVVISPDGLFPSLYREVIRRAPHEFKIACLEDIRALFPSDCNPFYAGFGNRDTDEFSYLRVGIPKGKIFIINPRGQITWNHRVDTKSYSSLHFLVNGMFPAMSSSEQEDYNSWNYWKMPLPDISI